MGGLAGAAGAARLNEPVWLVGGDAALVVAADRPTLWLLDIDDPATRDRLERVALLPGEAALYAGRADAAERLLRRRGARLLLATAGDIRIGEVVIEASPAGAPLVTVPAGWHLSVAARWPDCLVAVARRPIGADIERIDPAQPPALDLLTRRERERLAAIPDSDKARFFARAWTAKESHAKWTGEPRQIDPAVVETDEGQVASRWGRTRCGRYDRGDLTAAICTGD